MKKIGLITVYTGYNYGSALQAFAGKIILKQFGYEVELISIKGSFFKGRDIRLKKMLTIGWRTLKYSKNIKKSFSVYTDSFAKKASVETMEMFDSFIESDLKPIKMSYKTLKKKANKESYLAFLCGSDQIWNSTNFYVDPVYYLRFSPKFKRIAFAPSFGRDYIPEYNKKKIERYISEIPYRSIRETSGRKLISEITGKEATVLLDPTLIIDSEKWKDELGLKKIESKKIILAYFLDEPNKTAKLTIKNLKNKTGYKIIGIPYSRENNGWYDDYFSAGPKEFLELVASAGVICTDSFHGTIFSLNFQIPFYTFERNYGSAEKQSERIISILQLTGTENRFEKVYEGENFEMNFERCIKILKFERNKAIQYLTSAINEIESRTV